MTGRRLVLVAEPLPECLLCLEPTKRDVYDALGGLCTSCNATAHRLARQVEARALPEPLDRLPMPGQLVLDGDES